MLSWVQLFVTLLTVACQAPLSVEYSRQEYWSGLLCPPPGNLPDPGVEPTSFASPALAAGFFFFFYHSAAWEVRDCGWESNAHPTVPLRRIPEFGQCNWVRPIWPFLTEFPVWWHWRPSMVLRAVSGASVGFGHPRRIDLFLFLFWSTGRWGARSGQRTCRQVGGGGSCVFQEAFGHRVAELFPLPSSQ